MSIIDREAAICDVHAVIFASTMACLSGPIHDSLETVRLSPAYRYEWHRMYVLGGAPNDMVLTRLYTLAKQRGL